MGKKLSFDLTDENAETLKAIKNESRVPFGQTINSLIELFCRIPADVNAELLAFCKEKIKELYTEMDRAGEYCEYASVVEVRNAKFGVPHFIYFHSKEANAYNDTDTEMIEKACVREWATLQGNYG